MTAYPTDTYHLFGNLLRFLAHSPDTGGAYCLVESLTAPGAGAPPNRHPGEDEAFYVLDGSFAFTIGGETVAAETGAFVKIPDGAVHAFKNVGARPGRLLIINAPGRVHDAFFSQAGEPMPPGTRELPPQNGAPDIPRVIEIGRLNGLEFLLPPEQEAVG
ncbi:cupin domain-containing protein [Inquilinus limosus]|uniref:cupin domain-containing protein n=1 Tax=Inquilinus limosus TaxID=171674 RepID=UPI003F17BD6C